MSESEKSGCENTSWAFTSWLWNFLLDCDIPWGFFMIVSFFLLLSFKFDLWLVNWFDLIREIWYCWYKTFIWKWHLTTINFNYKIPSPWPWPSGHGWRWRWYWENLWTHTYHQTIYESDLFKGLEIMRCSNKVPMQIYIWAASWQNQQIACAPSEDSDQPGHPPSLIRVFAVHSVGS